MSPDAAVPNHDGSLASVDGFHVGSAVTSAHVRRARPCNLDDQLFDRPFDFEAFQAVRLLERLAPGRRPVGRQSSAGDEIVRFRVPATLAFPASSIDRIDAPSEQQPAAEMWVNFMGLTGPSGVLPRHYTELLVRRHIDFRGPERYVLQNWFDLFNHRLISLFYRAWEKYRFWIPYERGEYLRETPDTFTQSLRSLIGLGTPALHNRLQVSIPALPQSRSTPQEPAQANIQDLSLFRYAGLLSQRPRSAANLEALLADYFLVPVQVRQFQGQWLELEDSDQSRLGSNEPASMLGTGSIVGPRVWNVQGKFRVRLGPLTYQQFCAFFPDHNPTNRRKAFFLLSQLVRLFAGPEFDFDIQLTLRREEVPPTRLAADDEIGPRLGWNTWLCTSPPDADAEDAVIPSQEVTRLTAEHIGTQPVSMSTSS
jgi:type VI secretion system protein ImpH